MRTDDDQKDPRPAASPKRPARTTSFRGGYAAGRAEGGLRPPPASVRKTKGAATS